MNDEHWMQQALILAKEASHHGEVPVGAVLVLNNSVIGEGFNQPIKQNDPTAHAEIMALRSAAKNIGNYRLIDTTLYVTLEPCMMCLGAMVHARIKRLVYGAKDPRTGVIESVGRLSESPWFNHRIQCEGSVLVEASAHLLKDFFQARR